jgi:hypothetical protein
VTTGPTAGQGGSATRGSDAAGAGWWRGSENQTPTLPHRRINPGEGWPDQRQGSRTVVALPWRTWPIGLPSTTLLDGALLARPDPAARQLAEILVGEMRDGNPRGILYVDTLALALSMRLASEQEQGCAAPRPMTGGLSAAVFRPNAANN